ncbi:MAG: DNA-formamidopyrimidine glycosylase [Chloroflexota bacterium]|nr:DNA-formamidopyrimidine glycosylase [Chloroflexota bacterium]
MPELPEVETVRRSLVDHVVGRRIVSARVGSFVGVLGPAGDAVLPAMIGRTFTGLRRRGKYLIADLDDRTALLIHLRMTGSLQVAVATDPPIRFEHLAIGLDDGAELRFADQRKFGRVLHVDRDLLRALDRRLGPEPLSTAFTADRLGEMILGRRGKVKSLLLDQHLIAGLGNIYVDEALFRARIHPERSGADLSRDEVTRLHRAIRSSLRQGIAHNGTTFSSFQDGYGNRGDNAQNLQVYGKGRRGDACPRCGRPLTLAIVGGRSSHYCANCQRPPAEDRPGIDEPAPASNGRSGPE